MASKLHGVDVDIQIIKRKGDPIDSISDSVDAENNCKFIESQSMKIDNSNCTSNEYSNTAAKNTNNNNNNQTQVPDNDSSKFLGYVYSDFCKCSSIHYSSHFVERLMEFFQLN